MTNTGHKASSYLICTQSAFTMSAMTSGATSVVGVFSANIENQRTVSVSPFQQTLLAIKHVADDILFSARPRTSTSCIQRSQTAGARRVKSQLHFFYYGLQLRICSAVKPTDYEIPVTQSLKTEPRIKREYNIGCILCKIHAWKMASRKRQTYQNKAKNLCTICV